MARTTKAGTSTTTTKTAASGRARPTSAATGGPASSSRRRPVSAKAAVKKPPVKKAAAKRGVASRRGNGDLRPATQPATVVASVTRDLERLALVDADLANSGLAAAALALARDIDDRYNSATSKSMCAKALLDITDRLRELAPAEAERDELDDLARRRAARIAGHPAS